MKGRVIIFSITGCPFCMRAKDKMQKLGIDYIDINLDNYPERRAEAKERSGRNTVPQIFFNNRHIGGFNDFDKLSEAELQELIKEVEENPAPPDAPQPPSPGDSKNEEFHVLARRSPYPGSNQQRYPVPDFLVDWQESFPGYDPPLYTAQASPPVADPDILHPSNTSVVINFNCLDEGVNRRSHTGVIDVFNQLPRNPVGRTGIAGRGLLARWGPNHATHIIATRWKIGEDGLIVQKQDKNVLEFVAVKSPQSLKWAMPGGPMEVGESVSSSLRRILTKKVLVAVKPAIAEEIGNLGQRVDAIIENATEVYKGYMDTLRNTDNAWMETATLHFHDETREILGDIEFEAKDGAPIINWQEISGHINLRVSHSFILHKVAETRNANF